MNKTPPYQQGAMDMLNLIAKNEAPGGSLQFTIDFIARSIVGQNPNKWKSLYL